MTLQEQVKDALDEGRILILGSQILIAFQWRAVFENGFSKLPLYSQCLGVLALLAALVLFGCLVAPACYHNIVSQGEDTKELHGFSTKATELALIPFSGTLGIDLFLSSSGVAGNGLAVLIGIIGFLFALFFWFGLEIVVRCRSERPKQKVEKSGPTPISMRIDHVLTETRMVLPGAQALLGFQFLLFFADSFQQLPLHSRLLHLSSLFLVSFCVILLMTPPAFHRIVEQGQDTERFYTFATRLVLVAMVPLAIASCIEFYIVCEKVIPNSWVAGAASGALLIYFILLWFIYPWYLHLRELP